MGNFPTSHVYQRVTRQPLICCELVKEATLHLSFQNPWISASLCSSYGCRFKAMVAGKFMAVKKAPEICGSSLILVVSRILLASHCGPSGWWDDVIIIIMHFLFSIKWLSQVCVLFLFFLGDRDKWRTSLICAWVIGEEWSMNVYERWEVERSVENGRGKTELRLCEIHRFWPASQ